MLNKEFSLRDAIDLYRLDLQSRRVTESTLEFYDGRFRIILRWCDEQGVTALSDLTPHVIRQYLVGLQEHNLSSHYQHGMARAIRAFLNYCVRDELLEVNPFDRVAMPRLEQKVLSAIPESDIRTLLRACQCERDKAILMFLLDSGVRAKELCAMKAGDVNIRTGSVFVSSGKGQKQRYVMIGAKTRKQLIRYFSASRGGRPDEDEPLFTTERADKPLTYVSLSEMLRRLKRRTGVDATLHAFRRTFAITCLLSGMDIFTLQRLMGHADIVVLRRYLPLVRDDLPPAQLSNSHHENGRRRLAFLVQTA